MGKNPGHPVRLRPDCLDYPAVLRRCAGESRPLAVTAQGNLRVLEGPLLGFFSSARSTGEVILKTYDLAQALRGVDVTVVGGFQSPMEREFLDFLLRGTASVVVCPARGLGNMRIPRAWKDPLARGRLLLLSFFDDGVRCPTAAIAAKRNACVAALANRLLVAHAEPGGKTAGLCAAALTRGQPVFTVDSPDNAHLVTLGAVSLPADDLTLLTA